VRRWAPTWRSSPRHGPRPAHRSVVPAPGGGFGGSCFPKDVTALKQLAGNSGYHFQLLTAVIEVNELQKRLVIGKLKKHLGALAGRRIALLGLAFKPETDDMREAASLVLAGRLMAEGAVVTAYDPVVTRSPLLSGVRIAPTALDALRDAPMRRCWSPSGVSWSRWTGPPPARS